MNFHVFLIASKDTEKPMMTGIAVPMLSKIGWKVAEVIPESHAGVVTSATNVKKGISFTPFPKNMFQAFFQSSKLTKR